MEQLVDTLMPEDLRGAFSPFDLAAMNIQRGRDFGLPHYNKARELVGLEPVRNFSDITANIKVQDRLKALYTHINNVDG